MKKIISMVFLLLLLTACSGEERGKLTRVDVQKVDSEGNDQEVVMITDNKSIELLKEVFTHIKWDNKVVNMARESDVKATLFYTFDENMPEKLVEYEIWFNKHTGTATIISNHKDQTYGELDKEHAKTLKNILLN